MATNGGSSSSNPTRRRMVTFITSDHKEVKVPVEIAREFGRVREFFDGDLDRPEVKAPVGIARDFGRVSEFFDGDLDRPEVENATPFPLPNVDRRTLRVMVAFHKQIFPLSLEFQALEKERLFDLPSKYQALETERALLPSKYQALEIAREFELPSKYQALKKKRQELEEEFFGRQSDETIVELIKAADFLEDKELLDSVMPSFRMRFGLGDDKGVDFVYTAEAEAILLSRAASASGGAGS